MNIENEKTCLGGAIIITPQAFQKWLENGGYADFNAKSYQQLKEDYAKAGKPIETEEQIRNWILRMNNHKDGKLILAKAQTELAGERVNRWELYQDAKKTGRCLNCGWQDGDGVKVCYYDKKTGAITHENSREYMLSQMTPSQRSLLESYDSSIFLVYDDASLELMRPRLLSLVRFEDTAIGKKWRIGASIFDYDKYHTKEEVVEAWLKGKTNLDELLEQGWEIRSKEPEIGGDNSIFRGLEITKYSLQKPHVPCGGFGRLLTPYHIICSRCKEEVKLWEFGVDYDIG